LEIFYFDCSEKELKFVVFLKSWFSIPVSAVIENRKRKTKN
jgi:hypothetical protein